MNNKIHDDQEHAELRRLYSGLNAEHQGPSDDELVALLLDELDGSRRQEVVESMLRSPAASERYRILEDLHRETGRTTRKPRRLVPFAAVATVVLGIGIALLRPIGDNAPPIRGGNDTASPSNYQELPKHPGLCNGNCRRHNTLTRFLCSMNPARYFGRQRTWNSRCWYFLRQGERVFQRPARFFGLLKTPPESKRDRIGFG